MLPLTRVRPEFLAGCLAPTDRVGSGVRMSRSLSAVVPEPTLCLLDVCTAVTRY